MSQVVEKGVRVSAAPRFDHVPAPAGEGWNCAEPTPAPASAEFDVTATEPRRFAAAAGAVTEPVGAVASAVNVNALVAAFPAASSHRDRVRARCRCTARPDEAGRRVGPARGRGDRLGRVGPPAVASTGKVADAAPEPLSVTVATNPKLPAIFDLK